LLVWLIEATSGNIYGTTYSGGAKNSNCSSGTGGTVFKITLADALTTLHSFDYMDGANPIAGRIQPTDGNFYGTTGGAGTALTSLVAVGRSSKSRQPAR
jgi:uncharacterized repeat protein (TIGR03803 family)